MAFERISRSIYIYLYPSITIYNYTILLYHPFLEIRAYSSSSISLSLSIYNYLYRYNPFLRSMAFARIRRPVVSSLYIYLSSNRSIYISIDPYLYPCITIYTYIYLHNSFLRSTAFARTRRPSLYIYLSSDLSISISIHLYLYNSSI